MSGNPASPAANQKPASRADFHRILGSLEDPRILEILDLNPTVEDLEQAAICVAGDHDVLARNGRRVSRVAERVVEIITAEEDDEAPPTVREIPP